MGGGDEEVCVDHEAEFEGNELTWSGRSRSWGSRDEGHAEKGWIDEGGVEEGRVDGPRGVELVRWWWDSHVERRIDE